MGYIFRRSGAFFMRRSSEETRAAAVQALHFFELLKSEY